MAVLHAMSKKTLFFAQGKCKYPATVVNDSKDERVDCGKYNFTYSYFSVQRFLVFSSAVAQWRCGAVVLWCSGEVAQWRSSAVAQ